MLDEITAILIAVFVLGAGRCERPAAARCPQGWMHDGVGTAHSEFRDRGEFSCRFFPFKETDRVITDFRVRIPGRIYCGETTTPVVVDDRMVACRP